MLSFRLLNFNYQNKINSIHNTINQTVNLTYIKDYDRVINITSSKEIIKNLGIDIRLSNDDIRYILDITNKLYLLNRNSLKIYHEFIDFMNKTPNLKYKYFKSVEVLNYLNYNYLSITNLIEELDLLLEQINDKLSRSNTIDNYIDKVYTSVRDTNTNADDIVFMLHPEKSIVTSSSNKVGDYSTYDIDWLFRLIKIYELYGGIFPTTFSSFMNYYKKIFSELIDKHKNEVVGIINVVLGGENIKDIDIISKNLEDWFRKNYTELPNSIKENFI